MEEPGITYKAYADVPIEDKAVNPEIKYDKKQYEGYQEKTRNAHDGYVVTTYVDMYTNKANPQTIYSYTATYDKIEEQWIYGTKPTLREASIPSRSAGRSCAWLRAISEPSPSSIGQPPSR